MNIIHKIQEISPALSQVQARIAEYILANPEQVCFLSVKELARTLGTTEVTIFRFLNKIGLTSYVELKRELQEQVRYWLSPNERVAQAVRGAATTAPEQVFQQLIQAEETALRQTLASAGLGAVQAAVALLKQSDTVYVAGHELSEVIAQFTVFRLNQIGKSAEQLDVNNFGDVSRQLVSAGNKASFLLISLPIYSAETIALADYLHDSGVSYIAISDRHTSPVARQAKLSLVCSGDDTIFYASISAAIALVNLLCSMYAVTARDETESHQADARRVLEALQTSYEAEVARRRRRGDTGLLQD